MKRTYEIDHKQLGLVKAEIFLAISKGDCVDRAKRIVQEHIENILEASLRIGDPKINLTALAIYKIVTSY